MAAHRYWRVTIPTTIRGFASCAQLQLAETVGGPDVTQGAGGTPFASSSFGGYPPSAAFDNNGGTFWSSGDGPPQVLGYDFGSGNEKEIVEFSWMGRPDGECNRDSPPYGKLQYSDNGIAYSDQFDFEVPEPFEIGVPQYFTNPPPPPAEAVEVPESRVFSIFNNVAETEQVTSLRVFSLYNYSALQADASQLRTIVLKESDDPLELSEVRVFALVRGRVENPTVRAWTCTLDGHDFYVLRLGDVETMVFDLTTEQMVEWDGHNLPFWRAVAGMTWLGGAALGHEYGSNIVAGDDVFGLLWLLDPNRAIDDTPNVERRNTERPFNRVVTGQVLASGRQAIPCFAIFLDGDNYGLTASDFVPGVTLETSDDQGRTFESHGTITVPANYDQALQYEWLSLGQIENPGRIFRITDNGVFARIDSMKMNDDAG